MEHEENKEMGNADKKISIQKDGMPEYWYPFPPRYRKRIIFVLLMSLLLTVVVIMVIILLAYLILFWYLGKSVC